MSFFISSRKNPGSLIAGPGSLLERAAQALHAVARRFLLRAAHLLERAHGDRQNQRLDWDVHLCSPHPLEVTRLIHHTDHPFSIPNFGQPVLSCMKPAFKDQVHVLVRKARDEIHLRPYLENLINQLFILNLQNKLRPRKCFRERGKVEKLREIVEKVFLVFCVW